MKNFLLILVLCSICLGVTPTITSFNGGQVTRKMEPRTDYQKYQASNRTVENMLVTVQGPVQRRPGTLYVGNAKGSEFGTDPGLPKTTAISTIMELQKISTYTATFDSGVGTMPIGVYMVYSVTRSVFVVDVEYDTPTSGTVWWIYTTNLENLSNGVTASYDGNSITVNSVPVSNLDGDYYLANDIDASVTTTWNNGLGFYPIGEGNSNAYFSGTLDGQGYSISNLYVNADTNRRGGLFGVCDGASFYNINLVDVDITSTYGFTGGFAGFLDDTDAQKITVTGTINCRAQSGGFVGGEGIGGAGSTISYCSADTTLNTDGSVWCGLFSGTNQADYINCTARGTINGTGAYWTGGFIGIARNTSSFTNCIANGTIPLQREASELTNGGFVGRVDSVAEYVNCFYEESMNDLPFGGEDEIQRILAVGSPAPTSGYYSITFDSKTVDIPYNATESEAQALFDSEFGTGVIEVDGDYPIAGNRSQYLLFRKDYSRTDVSLAVIDTSFLGGSGSPYEWEVSTTNEAVYPSFTTEPSEGTGSNEVIRLVSFEYSTDDAYVLEVGGDDAGHQEHGGAITRREVM